MSSTHSCNSLVQDLSIGYEKKIIKVLLLAVELAILCLFYYKKGLGCGGIKVMKIGGSKSIFINSDS